MKNRILKNILAIIIILPLLGIFCCRNINVRAQEDNCSAGSNAMDISFQYLNRGSDGLSYKVMPGDMFEADIKNLCATRKMSINVYVHPRNLVGNTGAFDPYQKGAPNIVVEESETYPFDIPIDGSGGAGDYTIRIVGYLLDDAGNRTIGPFVDETDLIITTEGIVFPSATNDSSVVKGATGNYTFKIFGRNGGKFSVYVDQINGDNIKIADTPITSNTFSSTFRWDTSGTSLGSHKVIVALNNGTSDFFRVEVTDPSNGGSESSGFTLSKLNNFNIKGLLGSCSKDDLGGILCIVEKLINWLLDIGAVISFIMILYASGIYFTSYGDESKAELAKKTLIWSVIGVIVITAAMGIMKIIESILNNPSSLG